MNRFQTEGVELMRCLQTNCTATEPMEHCQRTQYCFSFFSSFKIGRLPFCLITRRISFCYVLLACNALQKKNFTTRLITREAATHFLQTHPNVATTLLTEQRACQRAPAMCNAVQAASELSLSDTLPVDKLLESEIIELAVRYLCQSPKGDWALPFIRNVKYETGTPNNSIVARRSI